MKKLLMSLSLICVLTIGFIPVSLAEDWVSVGTVRDSEVYLDRDSIKGLTEDVYFFTTKTIYSDKDGRDISRKLELSVPAAYMLERIEVNYKKKLIATRTGRLYDSNKRLLESYTELDLNYKKITPGTYNGALFDTTFSIYKKRQR